MQSLRASHQCSVQAPRRIVSCVRPIVSRSIVRKSQEENKAAETSKPAETPVMAKEERKPSVEGQDRRKEGQGMAIVTGGISIACGVAYLALVSMLDSRGGQLLPPPPEAFIP